MSFDSSRKRPPQRSWNDPLPPDKIPTNSEEEWLEQSSHQHHADQTVLSERMTIKVEPNTENLSSSTYNPLPSFHVDSLLESGVKPEEIEYVAVPEGAKRRGRPKGSKNGRKALQKMLLGGDARDCDLCRRSCPGSLAEDAVEGKFAEILGMELELRSGIVCRPCLKLVELLGEFKVCCLKAKEWFKDKSVDDDGSEDWFSNKTTKGLERTADIIREYVGRMEASEDDNVEEDQEDLDYKGDDFEATEPEIQDSSAKDSANIGEDYVKQFLEDSFQRLDATETDGVPAPKLKITVYTCEKCQRRFDSKIGYCYHVKLCKPDAAVREATLHTCPICSADFTSHWLMRDHLNKHRGVKRFSCRKVCNKTFYTELARRSHEKHCSNETTICTLCGVQLKSENSLGSHMAYIHGEAKIPCEVCGKMFKARKALLKHMTVHSDARNYPCEVCGKAFKSSWTVKVHMRIHTQEKPFQCSICGQGFTYKCILKSHLEQTHGSNHI
ncbi:zinc finger protein 490 [Culex quinquefasciatus]|uniref:Zinc finger protein 490 n=1 Tax=Culex quinquefasciatus TaxID=7176 RepID=B0WWV7_CULQU|nr:zinc finger protein 490 [Culex quinquefasciatus]|eukprot:XP_001861879.1 zinc finger protein 490 [Culex quinquefasciatus]